MKSAPNEQVVAGRIAREAVQLGIALSRTMIDGVRLDKEIEAFIRDEGGTPALKGYHPKFSQKPYEHTICLAINEGVVHGPPIKLVGPSQLVTIDLVVEYKGWHADTARTFTHSDDPRLQQFVAASKLIHEMGLEAVAPHQPMNMFGLMIENAASTQGYGVVQEYCGHGIGKDIHMSPQILSYYSPKADPFESGKAYAIEPVLAIESAYKLIHENDGWTVTANCLASHNEDTIFVGDSGITNLTGEEV